MIGPRAAMGLAFAFLLLPDSRAESQTLPSGPQVLSFFSDVDDSDQPYAVYVPKAYDPSKKYPLVVSLHGAGSNHRLNLRRVFGKSNAPGETDVEATRYFPPWKDVDYVVVSPYARGTLGYQGIPEKDVYDVLADVKRRFSIDEDRVYLTGLSMGGGGTLALGLSRPDLWAALAPVCPAPPEGTSDLLGNALNIPVHIYQGGADPVVPAKGVREIVDKMKSLDVKVGYTEYPGVSHNSWENAYQDEAVLTWFDQFRRNRHPEHVRFATRSYKYTDAYWIRLDELTPGTLARVDARIADGNRITVTTEHLTGLTLRLDGHPRVTGDKALEVSIDGVTLQSPNTGKVSLHKSNGAWTLGPAPASATAKRAGTEGPMAEAVASRHLYVYGTADNPSPGELQKRREQAMQASDWSMHIDWSTPFASFFSQIRPPSVFFRIVADKEVRPSDFARSNLVLFGTKESNRIIANYSDRLPLHLRPEAASDYGLAYVFAVDGHDVLVNSGLSWWTPASPAARARGQRFRFGNGPASNLAEYKDFLLFHRTPDVVVAEGSFDRHWKLTDTSVAKLKEAGVVTLREGDRDRSAAPTALRSTAHVAADGQPSYNRKEDVIYHRKFGTALTMDVFTPTRNPNGAGVIFAVSGGWFSDHRSIHVPFFAEFLKRGYTVFAVVHGSQPRFTIPEVLEDMHRATRFIRYHAKEYGIDPDRLGIFGGSAGGHLSLMQGTAGKDGDPKAQDPVDRVSSKVQAVACFFPPTDFLNYAEKGKVALGRGTLEGFKAPFDFVELDKINRSFNLILDEERRRIIGKEISPVYHVSKTSAPSLIIHGDADLLVPIQQALLIMDKFREAGVPAELVVKKGAAHGWPGLDKDIPILADWFDKYLTRGAVRNAAASRN